MRLADGTLAGSSLTMDVALEVTTDAFRYGGGTAVFASHPLQRCLRDLYTIASHLLVSDIVVGGEA